MRIWRRCSLRSAPCSAQVIEDRDTGRSKGFAFVEMGTDQEAEAAIAGLSGKEHDGRALTVNEARPRKSAAVAAVVAVVDAAATAVAVVAGWRRSRWSRRTLLSPVRVSQYLV